MPNVYPLFRFAPNSEIEQTIDMLNVYILIYSFILMFNTIECKSYWIVFQAFFFSSSGLSLYLRFGCTFLFKWVTMPFRISNCEFKKVKKWSRIRKNRNRVQIKISHHFGSVNRIRSLIPKINIDELIWIIMHECYDIGSAENSKLYITIEEEEKNINLMFASYYYVNLFQCNSWIRSKRDQVSRSLRMHLCKCQSFLLHSFRINKYQFNVFH